MNRAELRTYLQGTILQDPNGKKWSQTVCDGFLDQAVEIMWHEVTQATNGRWGVEEDPAPFGLIKGQSNYPFPDGLIQLERLEVVAYKESYDLTKIRKDDRNHFTEIERFHFPQYFYVDSPTIHIVPEPHIDLPDALMAHGVWGHGPFLDDAAVPNFPVPYHFGVAYRAGMMGLGIDETDPHWIAVEYRATLRRLTEMMQQDFRQEATDSSDHGW